MSSSSRILLVEDNPQTRKLFRVTLESHGCEVLEAPDGHTALALVAGERCPDLIIQDLLLPDMDGVELVAQLRAQPGCDRVPIIAFSGFAQRMFSEEADGAGFADRLLKPVEPSQLLEMVRPHVALAPHDAPAATPAARRVLIADDDPVQRKLTRLRLRDAGFDVIEAADGVAAIELARSWRPDAVVTERHTEIGHELLSGSGSPLLDVAAGIALTHHERWDGAGYPRGLRGEGIPLEGRIAAIADVFDALTSDRVYRPRMQVRRAVAVMIEGRGTHFDPDLLDQFIDSLDAVVAIGERPAAGLP